MNKSTQHNKFAVYTQPYEENMIANLVNKNVRLTTENLNPVTDLTPRIADYLSSTQRQWNHSKAALTSFLRGNNAIIDVDTLDVEWKMMGTGFMHARSGENLNANVQYVGYQKSVFEIKLDVDWYTRTDVLTALLGKEEFNVRVVDGPVPDGMGFYVYKVQLVGDDPNAYLDQIYLEEGQIWMKLFATSGEATSDRGSTQLVGKGASWVEFHNNLSHFSKKITVTDEALYASPYTLLRGYDVDKNGKKRPNEEKYMIPNVQAEFISQAEYEKDLMLTYGRQEAKRINDNSSSYPVDQGAGLFEFLREGNFIEVPPTSYAIPQIIEHIDEIWDQTVPYEQRQVKIFTGSGGLNLVQEYAKRELNSQGVLTHYKDITSGGGETYGKGYEGRVLKTSYITEFQLYPWGHVKFIHLPLLDDRQLNTGPTYKGKPYSSYNFIAMDVGFGEGGDSNIALLKRRNTTNWTYVCGTVSPFGPINNMANRGKFSPAHGGAFYELHHDDYLGLIVKDTGRTLWAVPALSL